MTQTAKTALALLCPSVTSIGLTRWVREGGEKLPVRPTDGDRAAQCERAMARSCGLRLRGF
jgi:hypothetical protein